MVPSGNSPSDGFNGSTNRSRPCNVILATSFPILLDGLQGRFKSERDFRVVSSCTNGAQALNAVIRQQPDVLVLDLQIDGESAFDLLRDLRARRSDTRVVVLADRINADEMLELTKLGVKGIVLKAMPGDLLIVCVRKVYAGATWFERVSMSRAFDRLLRWKEQEEATGRLTHRQLEITRLVASGCSNREIATRLAITEGTVKSHLHTVYEKFGLRGRVELILHAQRLDLLDPPTESSTRRKKAS